MSLSPFKNSSGKSPSGVKSTGSMNAAAARALASTPEGLALLNAHMAKAAAVSGTSVRKSVVGKSVDSLIQGNNAVGGGVPQSSVVDSSKSDVDTVAALQFSAVKRQLRDAEEAKRQLEAETKRLKFVIAKMHEAMEDRGDDPEQVVKGTAASSIKKQFKALQMERDALLDELKLAQTNHRAVALAEARAAAAEAERFAIAVLAGDAAGQGNAAATTGGGDVNATLLLKDKYERRIHGYQSKLANAKEATAKAQQRANEAEKVVAREQEVGAAAAQAVNEWQHRCHEAEAEAQEARAAYEELVNTPSAPLEEVEALTRRADELKNTNERLAASRDASERRAQAAEQEVVGLKQQLTTLQADHARATEELASASASASTTKTTEQELAEVRQQLAAIQAERAKIHDELASATATKATSEQELAEVTRQLSALQAEHVRTKQELEELASAASASTASAASATAATASSEQELAEVTRQLAALQAEHTKTKEELASAVASSSAMQDPSPIDATKTTDQDLADVRRQLASLEAEHAKSREELAQASASASTRQRMLLATKARVDVLSLARDELAEDLSVARAALNRVYIHNTTTTTTHR